MEGILKGTSIIKLAITISLFLVIASSCFADQDKEVAVASAVNNFLQLVDSDQFDESWAAASVFFKKNVSRHAWKKQLKEVRSVFGSKARRVVKSKKHTNALPGVPDGAYIVMQCSTTYEKKQDGQETVTFVLEDDGEWRVAGYFIR